MNEPWYEAISSFFSTGGVKPCLMKRNERNMCPLPIYLSHDGNGKLCIQLKEIEAEQHILLLDNLQFQKLLMSDLEGYAPTWDKNGKTRKARGIFAIYYEGPNSKIEKRDWVLRMYPLFLNAAKRITE